ncbi:hypothetical protein OA77_26375, partial [Pseudomonas coronafaciens]
MNGIIDMDTDTAQQTTEQVHSPAEDMGKWADEPAMMSSPPEGDAPASPDFTPIQHAPQVRVKPPVKPQV